MIGKNMFTVSKEPLKFKVNSFVNSGYSNIYKKSKNTKNYLSMSGRAGDKNQERVSSTERNLHKLTSKIYMNNININANNYIINTNQFSKSNLIPINKIEKYINNTKSNKQENNNPNYIINNINNSVSSIPINIISINNNNNSNSTLSSNNLSNINNINININNNTSTSSQNKLKKRSNSLLNHKILNSKNQLSNNNISLNNNSLKTNFLLSNLNINKKQINYYGMFRAAGNEIVTKHKKQHNSNLINNRSTTTIIDTKNVSQNIHSKLALHSKRLNKDNINADFNSNNQSLENILVELVDKNTKHHIIKKDSPRIPNKNSSMENIFDYNLPFNKVLNKGQKEVNYIKADFSELFRHSMLWENILNFVGAIDSKENADMYLNKVFYFMEDEILKNNLKFDIFENGLLNKLYIKNMKIIFIFFIYIKFIILEFDYDTSIKINIRSILNGFIECLLLIIKLYVLNNNKNKCDFTKEFYDIYDKQIINHNINKLYYEPNNFFINSQSKTVDFYINLIKQFSNNFFKNGILQFVHNITFDLIRTMDTTKLKNIVNYIINCILFFPIKNKGLITNESNNDLNIENDDEFNLAKIEELPTPYLPEIKNNNYTLILDLDETLVHHFVTPSGGIFIIRPGCLKFLEEMSAYCEISVFTAATQDYADSILDLLDKDKILIKHRLYRQHVSIFGLSIVKDLSKLGRDLGKIIIIDNLSDNYKLQQNNGLLIKTWIEDIFDTQLNDIGSVLKEIFIRKPNDLRPYIKIINDEINIRIKNNYNNPYNNLDLAKLFGHIQTENK